MAALTDINERTRVMEFAIQDASELVLLPTTTTVGQYPFVPLGTATEGSMAIDAELNPYRLTPNGWVGG